MKPVIHLLVQDGDGWVMWCTSGKGRVDSPHGNRLCGKCRQLVRAGVEDETIDPDDVRRWL